MPAAEMKKVMEEYRRLRSVVPLGTLHTKKEYERAVQMLDAILDEIGEHEKHPLAELADAISVFVEGYEAEHVSPLPGDPSEVLRSLMQEREARKTPSPLTGEGWGEGDQRA